MTLSIRAATEENIQILVVDVLTANERGLSVWQRVGFQPYQMTLKAYVGN